MVRTPRSVVSAVSAAAFLAAIPDAPALVADCARIFFVRWYRGLHCYRCSPSDLQLQPSHPRPQVRLQYWNCTTVATSSSTAPASPTTTGTTSWIPCGRTRAVLSARRTPKTVTSAEHSAVLSLFLFSPSPVGLATV
uniref:Uncharacterized protein n=1 Tax=Lygus hesperus TaxID=30085 RepID=A0A146LSX6_LYGHE